MAIEIGGSAAQQAFVQALDRRADTKNSAEDSARRSEDSRAREDSSDRERRAQRAADRGGIDIDV